MVAGIKKFSFSKKFLTIIKFVYGGITIASTPTSGLVAL